MLLAQRTVLLLLVLRGKVYLIADLLFFALGCTTCRRRKVKCGEERPVCRRCSSLGIGCRWDVKRGKSHAPVHIQPAQPATTTSSAIEPASSSNDFTLDPQLAETAVQQISDTRLGIWSSIPDAFKALTPLCSSLSAVDIPCSNSLVLSQQDQKYFQFFPSSSVVSYYIKSWPWSCFSYLYQGPAVSSNVIMRMMLALSANDMYRQGLAIRPPGRPTAEDHARYHYGLAVKEFRQSLATREGPISQPELEAIFATMFLMVSYEWQFGQSVDDLQLHIRGVRSLLECQPALFGSKDVEEVLMCSDSTEDGSTPKVSFVPEQLLLWILYIESGCCAMGVTGSLYDYVSKSENLAIHPDRLYRSARLWGRCYWRNRYPEQEVSDDIENYRALELLHAGMTLRQRIWDALVNTSVDTSHQAELVSKDIKAIRESFSDLFLTAKFAGPGSTRRTLITINLAVSTFYAQVIFHRRLLYHPGPPSAFHRTAVANIIEIAEKQYKSDPRLIRRLHWPLLMAVIETDDGSKRAWLRERLFELRTLHSESQWASDVADEVLALQDASKGEFADLATLLRLRACV
ncbi:hypothetical protein BDV18DRAFT_120206 [Aspergillus unguis]